MITETSGNLLRDDAEALVNTVNTVGVMGKGVALQFKRAFPEIFAEYVRACEDGRMRPGRVLAIRVSDGRWILNFPTKRHWRQPSRMEDIRSGLDDLVRHLTEKRIRSVAIPPLGCGNGGLAWPQVRRLIIEKLADLDADVRLYAPGTPAPSDMPVRTRRPEMTPTRARLIAALHRYAFTAFTSGVTETPRLSLVEAQKVVYLMQAAGVGLGLRFVRYHYGPFSPELNRRLSDLEGHHLVGYGDGTGGARADLEVPSSSAEAADETVAADNTFNTAWKQVRTAISGYEYPEGLELLATLHFLIADRTDDRLDPPSLVDAIHGWSERKRRLYRRADVEAALVRLKKAELCPSP
ncbi:type II toxin-antitoxin system antitoxin DNA ADP-ribosyl glycohydrolase DarG [Allonocardiopsis opalescens]|uniref:O-acetyl-ADP-ribose deacetylase (Regulator of RNase III) n=1 Tax=Allonocardiopsis opalescens TaxID=1144618 RepID=A0A2T0QCL8_9ACTN|nr:macro domain-containing protein [Allonocardiopsis opalescens]PRY01648.1 O-acetyl-ADP-ribose deacetylase (regulator of RNase III) [Allonocardiopsis opalescens]